MPDDDHFPISVQDAKRLFADWKAAPAHRARGLRRPRFDRADVARGALAPRAGARSAPDRRHRRSRLARRGRARGARRQAAGAQRSICSIARCAGPAPSRRPDCRRRRATARYRLLAQGRAAERRDAYPHRAHPRRPGRNAADAAAARQRHRRSCGDGAGDRARRRACWRGRCSTFRSRN